MKYTLFALSTALVLSACAPASRIILLPEADGKASAVEVKSAGGSAVLSAPYKTATVSTRGDVAVGETNDAEVREKYGQLLTLRPEAGQKFVLYFAEGGTQLTPDSEAQLADIVKRASERSGGEIFVTGHTDRVGSVEANDALSLKRARSIREMLISRNFKADLIEAIGRGEREPLVATEDEVSEPKNRRAEILVR